MTYNQARIVTVSSPYGGTGKTSMAVNVGALAARNGLRVAIVDTAMQSPGLANALGAAAARSLADYLSGDCEITNTVLHLPPESAGEGALFAVAACRGQQNAVGALVGGYDPGLLVEGCRELIDCLDLDLLLLDTPPGLNTEAIVCMGMADANLHIDRIRGQRSLQGLPPSLLVVNMVPEPMTDLEVLDNARSAYGNVPVVILRYVAEFAAIRPGEVFVSVHPAHEVALRIQSLTRALTGRSLPEYTPHTYIF
ncbi:nucleotide-binding protein [Streptosporangium soli]|nr:P-loop NTPase [Streptosporangium sp. KLBMP 9127]